LFTLTVLVGTVVSIYLAFPARHNVLLTTAIELHREPPAWDLTAPSALEVRAWLSGVVGRNPAPPLPGDGTAVTARVLSAARLQVLNRAAAVMRVQVGDDEITYLVQHARGIAPEHTDRDDGELRALAWLSGPYTVVAVGAAGSAEHWRAAFKH
jgi:hypothetical protein